MTTENHTAGPWSIGQYDWLVETADDIEVAQANASEKNFRANARLIASAPCLLDALVDLLEKAELADEELTGPADKQFFSPSLIQKCRAAITKATSEGDET